MVEPNKVTLYPFLKPWMGNASQAGALTGDGEIEGIGVKEGNLDGRLLGESEGIEGEEGLADTLLLGEMEGIEVKEGQEDRVRLGVGLGVLLRVTKVSLSSCPQAL